MGSHITGNGVWFMCVCAVIKWFPQVILKGQGSMQEISVCRDRDGTHREGKRREEKGRARPIPEEAKHVLH